MAWLTTSVGGRPALYGLAGDGRPLVFLHGWGLSYQTYKAALTQLIQHHMRVYAPALPGFGRTPELPRGSLTLASYARWLDQFMAAVGIDEPVTLVGHSFGGGVAIQTAHDSPERVARLILINSIGGATWSRTGGIIHTMRERPLWDWGLHLQADLLPMRQLTRVVPVIVADAVPNLLRNARAIWRVGYLARTADLTAELEELKRRRLPIVILWGQQDTVIPRASVESLRLALGDPQLITVPGNHSWLLADPAAFGEVMTNVISAAPPASGERDPIAVPPQELTTAPGPEEPAAPVDRSERSERSLPGWSDLLPPATPPARLDGPAVDELPGPSAPPPGQPRRNQEPTT